MPAEELHKKMGELIKGSEEGKQWLTDLANKIKEDIKKEDYEDAIGQYSNDDDDDGFDDLDADDIDISDLFK